MSVLRKCLCMSLVLSLIDRGYLFESVTSNMDEGYCDSLPNCVCMKMEGLHMDKRKLVCENEINVQALTSIYLHPVRYSTTFTVICSPDISPQVLKRDFYTLLNLKTFNLDFNTLSVYSCPEPPMPYFSFITPSYPQKSVANQSTTLMQLYITCGEYKKEFSLQRKHLLGLKSLRELSIICQSLTDMPVDIFYDTSILLRKIKIQSTQVVFIYADTFSSLLNLAELSINKNPIRTILNGTFNNLSSLNVLDLSDNILINLADDLFQGLGDLKRLNLSNNRLSSLPKSTRNLVNLTVLDVRCNSLDQITAIEGLANLKQLFLDYNKLFYLNASIIASLKSIDDIYLSGNAIINLDLIPIPLNNLYEFVFNHNSQPSFHIEPFLSGDKIEALTFSNSSITSIHPAFLEKIPRINRVDFSKNKLSSIPAHLFAKNEDLLKVILKENNISELLLTVFSNNSKLETLDISSNRISNLPDMIFANNPQLRYLYISQNQLTSLSSNLFYNNTSLRELKINDNKLTFIDPMLLSTNSKLYTLYFGGNMLQNISKEIFMSINTSLIDLHLARNCISSLPSLELPRLKKFNLSHNSLEYIQEGLFQYFPSLEILDLSNNQIKNISNTLLFPEDMEMKLLDLSHNHLSYIPEKMLKNKNIIIDSINFSANAMTSFYVDRVEGVKELIELRVAENNLSYFGLDQNYEHWNLYPSIKLLDLSSNNLDFKNDSSWFYDDQKRSWGKTTIILWFPNVEVLLLSNNSISRIFLEWRDDLHNLRLLDLRYNKIRRIIHQDIMFTSPNAPHIFPVQNPIPKRILHPRINGTDPPPAPPASLIVDLRGNLIHSIDIPRKKVKQILLNRNGSVPEGIYGHARILLDDNPFTCDCSILDFLRIVQNDVAPVSDLMRLTGRDWILPARFEIGNLSCWEPKSIRGSLIAEPETWMHHILPLMGLCSLWRE